MSDGPGGQLIRKEYLILSFGTGHVFDDSHFWAYCRSLARVPEADWVLLSDNIPPEAEERAFGLGLEIEHIPPVKNLFRDRHLAYWNYLNDHGHKYRYVVISDCRDVLFQKSPFLWVDNWRSRFNSVQGNKDFLDHFVVLTAEGFKTTSSGFACIDDFEFQRDVPQEHLKDLKEKWVVNGGVSVGTYQALMHYHFLVWATMLKTRRCCTDQAAINYLMAYLSQDATYSLSFPQHDWLCLTGEGVKEGAVKPQYDGALKNPQGEAYCMIHQWDRLSDSLRQDLLAHLDG